MKLSEEQIKEIIESSMPNIKRGVAEDLQEIMFNQIKYIAQEEISEFAREWIKTHVLPEVEKELIEAKQGLITLGIQTADTIVETLSKALTKQLQENLSQPWNRSKIMEAMFK